MGVIATQVNKKIQKLKTGIGNGTANNPNNPSPKPIFISTDSLPAATENVFYTFTLDLDGGVGTITWSISSGALPLGLTLTQDGKIQGTPLNGLDAVFTVKVVDSQSPPATASKTYNLVVVDKPNTETASKYVMLHEATVNENYAKSSTATSGSFVAARNAAISEAQGLYMPESETVMSKPQAPPSGNKHDLWTTGNYWWPRIYNATDSNGELIFDASKVSGTPTNQRNGGGRWMPGDQYTETQRSTAYYGTSDKSKWQVDYANTGKKQMRCLAWDPVKQEYNGEPYVNRDPNHNEHMMDSRKDGGWLKSRNRDIHRAIYGYFFSKLPNGPWNESLAIKGVKIIRVWYINAATKMNPNLDYAQAIPGHHGGFGRAEGSVDLEYLPRVIDAVNLLKASSSPSWTNADNIAFRNWLLAYMNWLNVPSQRTTAQVGNILTQKHLQRIASYLFLGEQSIAYGIMKNEVFPWLDRAMATTNSEDTIGTTPLGSFRLEWNRPDSWGYSTKVIKMWLELAEACEKIVPPPGQPKLDLWNYVTPSGKSLRKAVDFHYSYAIKGGRFNNTPALNAEHMVSVMRIASDVWHDAATAKWWPEFLQPRHNAWLTGKHDRYQILDGHFRLSGRYGHANKPAQ